MSEDTLPEPQPPTPQPPTQPNTTPTPYRDTADATEATMTAARATAREALWGPVLLVFGVLLWAFVVMGQLTTSYAPDRHSMLLGEGAAVLFVLVTTTVAWVLAMRRSLAALPPVGTSGRISRGFALGCLPSIGWCLALVFAMMVGKASSRSDGLVTVLLLAGAGAAFAAGRRLSPAVEATEHGRVLGRVLWVAAALITSAAIIALAAS